MSPELECQSCKKRFGEEMQKLGHGVVCNRLGEILWKDKMGNKKIENL